MATALLPIGERVLHEIHQLKQPVRPFHGKQLTFMRAGEFVAQDFQRRFLVDRILTDGEPAVIGGPRKALKTSISIDLAVSLASGTRFLGHFNVPRSLPVGVISGESGGGSLKYAFRRVCEARGIQNPGSLPVHFLLDLPSLQNTDEMEAICQQVREQGMRVVFLDPLYLLLAGDGSKLNTANLFDVGPVLRKLCRQVQAAGATPILIHHFRKAGGQPGAAIVNRPPDLDDLSGAGVGEFARQWILLATRQPYDVHTGEHRMWMTVGGSAGHGGSWAVDVREGLLNADFEGRMWQVMVRTQTEQYEFDRQAREARQVERQEHKDNQDRRILLDALRKFPAGETQSGLVDASGLPKSIVRKLLPVLLAERQVRKCKVIKPAGPGTRPYEGYVLVPGSRAGEHIAPPSDEPDEDSDDVHMEE